MQFFISLFFFSPPYERIMGESSTKHSPLALFFFSFFRVAIISRASVPLFRSRISPQWHIELGRLWTSVPWRVACDIFPVMCSHAMPGQYNQTTPNSRLHIWLNEVGFYSSVQKWRTFLQMSSKSDCCCTCLKASFLLFSVHFSDLFCCCCLWLCSLSFLASPRSIIMIQLSRYAEDVVMLEPRFKGKKLFEYHLYSEWLQFPPLSNYTVYAGLEDDSGLRCWFLCYIRVRCVERDGFLCWLIQR